MYSWREILFYSQEHPLLFTQFLFWAFFAAVLLIYSFIYKKNQLRLLYLLAVSIFFYYKSGGYFFYLLIFSTVVDYVIGAMIYRSDNELRRKIYVSISVIINLGLLSYFKYSYFYTDLVNQVLGTDLHAYNYLASLANSISGRRFDTSSILLPVGISFYTFQTISYSVDIYRKKIEPARNILDFGFFVTFFPQLVAGPIVRAAEFLPQMYKRYSLTTEEYNRALFLIMNGLIKKILISDYISFNFVDRVFDTPKLYSGFENLMAVYGYTIQIYCDFSGYTDIAIGLALLLGFSLPINFNSPYQAVNITDFWRRWHISLSSWLRDYLYIPLGGNRKGKVRTYINLFLTMLLGGLWHGASLRFIIWGGLHGLALAFHKLWIKVFPPREKSNGFIMLLSGLITFHFVAFCWMFFRAVSVDTVGIMLNRIFLNFQSEMISDIVQAYWRIFLLMLLGYLMHFLPMRWKTTAKARFGAIPLPGKAVILAGLALLLYQITSSGVQPFIYFQF